MSSFFTVFESMRILFTPLWSLVNASHISKFSFFKIECDIFSCLCLSHSNGLVNYTAASTASTIDKISPDEIPKITKNAV